MEADNKDVKTGNQLPQPVAVPLVAVPEKEPPKPEVKAEESKTPKKPKKPREKKKKEQKKDGDAGKSSPDAATKEEKKKEPELIPIDPKVFSQNIKQYYQQYYNTLCRYRNGRIRCRKWRRTTPKY